MKYIKNIENFEYLNEELDFRKMWGDYKSYLITIGLLAGISNYTNIKALAGYKLSHSEISNIVNDVNYKPSGENKVLVDTIKLNLIDYIKSSNKIEGSKKSSIIKAIDSLSIVIAPDRFADGIAQGNVIGVHFLYIDYPTKKIKNAIVLNGDAFNGGLFSGSDDKTKVTTLIHELWHFIDAKLYTNNKSEKYGYYSDILDISELLDMDIVSYNDLGKKRLEKKIEIIFKRRGMKNTKKGKKYLASLIVENRKYITSPEEVFARFHSMKMWMFRNGIIDSPTDNITKDDIIKIIDDYDIVDLFAKQNIDFFELLFYMKIDFNSENDDSENLKGFNQIVSNYNDFNKNKRNV